MVSGPPHLRVILRDGARGSRLVCWGLADQPCAPASPARFDGARYMQLSCGAPDERCAFALRLEVRGTGPIEVTAHADYLSLTSTRALDAVRAALPAWARGAEWTNYTSMLVSREV